MFQLFRVLKELLMFSAKPRYSAMINTQMYHIYTYMYKVIHIITYVH